MWSFAKGLSDPHACRFAYCAAFVTPTLPASRGSLPPEGAAPSAAWQSQFRDGNLHGRGSY